MFPSTEEIGIDLRFHEGGMTGTVQETEPDAAGEFHRSGFHTVVWR